jgi:hypothetical protein
LISQPVAPLGEICAWRRETLESSSTMSHSRLRPMVAPLGGMTRRLPSATTTARRRVCPAPEPTSSSASWWRVLVE